MNVLPSSQRRTTKDFFAVQKGYFSSFNCHFFGNRNSCICKRGQTCSVLSNFEASAKTKKKAKVSQRDSTCQGSSFGGRRPRQADYSGLQPNSSKNSQEHSEITTWLFFGKASPLAHERISPDLISGLGISCHFVNLSVHDIRLCRGNVVSLNHVCAKPCGMGDTVRAKRG